MCKFKRFFMTDEYLFRYMPVSDHAQRFVWITEVLKERKIFVPAAKDLNDPFELIFEMNSSGESPVADQLEAMMDWKTLKDKMGVISFTKSPLNLLMWSHYAQGHKGICLKFKINNKDRYSKKFKEISYSDKIKKYEDNEIFWTKASDWSYEQEVRFISVSDCNKHVKLDQIGLDLEEIILGPNISSDDVMKIIILIEGSDLKYSLSCAELLQTSYKLSLAALGIAGIKEKYIKIKALQKVAEKYK